MRFLRNRFISKFLAVLFLFLIVESTMHATVSYALTTGPHQPEYISYEEPGATDMVNLLTGDFSFNLPLLDVPGPEGGFSVPLTYNAGIGPEQEASWVGLGWTLNVGAITRSVVQYPDDASGEVQSVTRKDLVGVRGWTSSALGLGQMGWNTQQGHYGSLSLLGIINYQYDKEGSSGGLVGINVGSNGVSFDPIQFASAVFTIATWGVGGVAVTAGKIAVQAAVSIGVGAVMSYVSGNQTPNTPTDGYWEYSKRTSSGFLGIWEDYWIWLDQTRHEEMFGILNFDKSQYKYSGAYNTVINKKINNGILQAMQEFSTTGTNRGNASDITYNIPDGDNYQNATSPISLATDNYSVKALGISGSIKPYRLDIGSVSMPRDMSADYNRLAPVQYQSYKVPFIYEGLNSNSHFYHTGAPVQVSSPNFYFGMSAAFQAQIDFPNILTYNLSDIIFQNQIKADLVDTKKIPMANHVEWLSNEEIRSTSAGFTNGFMDYFSTADRIAFRDVLPFKGTFSSAFFNKITGDLTLAETDRSYFSSSQTAKVYINYPVGSNAFSSWLNIGPVDVTLSAMDANTKVRITFPSGFALPTANIYFISLITNTVPKMPKSIGGYSITGANGITYHFSIPVFDYNNYTGIYSKANPTTQYSIVKRNEPFANTWLLTGITGSDFVDRNNNGAIDEEDWGYWVKFKYGQYTNDYTWRVPYSGEQIDAQDKTTTFSQGSKQLYFLNSIQTRSHVALFLKDTRNDNLDKDKLRGSLRLREIALLTKENYKRLFMAASQGGFGLTSDEGLQNISKVWMLGDFYSTTGTHPSQGSFVIQNAIKRIRFNQTYDLCPGTSNSNDPNKGKLTLASVAIIGRNDLKSIPDYKFEYGNNPAYDVNKWDGWGAYSSSGSTGYNTHQASASDADGAAWSLTRITNPLGSSIDVAYERDTYSSISGETITEFVNYNNGRSSYGYYGAGSMGELAVPNPSQFSVGDAVYVSGQVDYTCYQNSPGTRKSYSGDYTVSAVGNNSINLGINFREITPCNIGQPVYFNQDYGTIKKTIKAKKGGNIRVASISLSDQGKVQKSRYLYTANNTNNGFSSGVVAREPEYIKTKDYPFYDLPGYPFTPVMYSRVSVLTGNLATDYDFHTKQVYEFETPKSDMVVSSISSTYPYSNINLKIIKSEISDYTSKIGKLKSVKMYDKYNQVDPVSSTVIDYTSQIVNPGSTPNTTQNNYQGIYSEGSLMFERIGETWFKMERSTILKYPYELVKVVNTRDGFSSETENKAWDFTTGIVVEKTEKSPLGLRSKSVKKLAYTIPAYAKMGSKAVNAANKNMLGHEAASYTYQVDAAGNNIGLLSASVQTWKSNWGNYRYLNGANYSEGTEGSPDVWRKHQNYVYKGTYANLRADGSLNFTPSQEFSFASGAANTGWQKTGEVTRYDHYSAALEGKDLNNIFSSSKKDISAKQVYANSSNATYHEFAYSGAEDWDASGTGTYFGGEVAKGAGTKVTKTPTGTETHTGQNAVQIGAAGKAFIYKPASLTNGRVYRVSAWTNSLAGAIYYSLNGGAEQTIFPVSTMKVGSWYQINVEIPVGTFSSLEVGVKSTSGTVSFDDFRFQPRDGSLTANVYDPVTGAVTFVLDNQNMFTQYEYNDRGQLVKTYSESFMYGVKLVSESKVNYKRFNVNQ